jgi:predicted transcriptional regulator
MGKNVQKKYYTSPEVITKILILKRIQNKKNQDIANVLHISRNTVSKVVNDKRVQEEFSSIVEEYLAMHVGEAANNLVKIMRKAKSDSARLDATMKVLAFGGVQVVDKAEITATVAEAQENPLKEITTKEELRKLLRGEPDG